MSSRKYLRFNLRASFFCLVLLLGSMFNSAHAQTAIYLESTTPDMVGRQLVFELREALRRSAGLSLADRSRDARIHVRIVTLDPSSGANSNSTVYSAVITVQTFHETPVDMYLTSYVGTCGSFGVASCARSLLAGIDEQATHVRTLIRSMADGMNN